MTRTSSKRLFGKLFNAVAVAAALCASTASQADVLNFEQPYDGYFLFAGDTVQFGNYRVQAYGLGGFAGSVDTNAACSAEQLCPTNNTTRYYSAFDDNYMVFGMADNTGFSLSSLDASFIGAGASSYPVVSALLYVTGFAASGNAYDAWLNLAGPTAGSFQFATFDLTGFGDGELFTDVRVAAYACDANGDCDRTQNQANFAIDNIVTINAVPEPGSFALLGLGLLGLRSFSRRRAA